MKQNLEVAEVSLHNSCKNAPTFYCCIMMNNFIAMFSSCWEDKEWCEDTNPAGQEESGKWFCLWWGELWRSHTAILPWPEQFQLIFGLSLKLPKPVIRDFGKNPWVSYKDRYQTPHANCQYWLLHEGEVETTQCYCFTCWEMLGFGVFAKIKALCSLSFKLIAPDCSPNVLSASAYHLKTHKNSPMLRILRNT